MCVSKKSQAIFLFLKLLESRLPMFIYRIGFAPSLIAAENWINAGHIYLNNKIEYNIKKPVKLHDFITFNPIIWEKITNNFVRILYYGSKATWRRRCTPTKLWSLKKIVRAHFISIPNYIYADLKTFSLYWWKDAVPSSIKYYFSVNISNILKYVTI